ncbi:glycosyltransferase family 2 protein [Virgibacillus sp. MSJ-26]|uniref:glycosyltransferase n=1 Tax=Virgibacillus sp. MSJ-26 TaxID=2841522 RepID=UPI001C107032|nr:glycosyltransferase family 2 protein [Virgibacillus sp. MSJ-26]MBU5467628.1 glycosyltransferase family 2 protein [Virgibacillus sp. MSJ-26]
MVTISLCMIVKNEEEVLERCLRSVKDLVDEINIVDTGSTDNTVDIAKKLTDRVYHFKWTGKFKDARNESFKKATKDYILYLDADDVLLKEDRKKFKKLKKTLDPSIDSVSMYYNAGLDEYGNITLRYRRNRLVKRSRNFKWKGDCHNYLEVSGNIVNSNIAVTHKKTSHSVGRNLNIYQSKLENKEEFTPRDYFYYGNELRENGHYEEAIKQYTKHVSLNEGWIEDKVYSCIYRADCYRFLGKSEEELESLYSSLLFSKTPRPETCSRLGYHFQQKREFESAVFWYKLATTIKEDPNKWSFTYPAYSTWYPHLQLCVCYYNLQDFENAYKHNELAREHRPGDEQILFNKELLEKRQHLVSGNK